MRNVVINGVEYEASNPVGGPRTEIAYPCWGCAGKDDDHKLCNALPECDGIIWKKVELITPPKEINIDMKVKVTYNTSDGKVFENHQDAIKHQEHLEDEK